MSMTLLDLAAKLTLDDSEFKAQTENAKSAFSKIGDVAKIGLGVATAAVGAATTAVGALAKSAVEGYAEFEQLEGGVKKLYGNMGKSLEDYAKDNGKTTAEVKDQWQALEDAQNQVLSDAKEAYKTAGLSANDYMETATSFSASLISSLGGDTMKAAEQTKVAMVAISDNVNTFGTNMEDVTNAFKGFSKQNYTMLDNLKLGYGGTKTEMERLIADANEWGAANGEAADLTIDSFSDVVTAIQRIQEKQNIAGTTMREGTTTIEGSINMTKAAWENLIASLGNSEADISALVTNVMESATNVFNNILPIAQQALSGIGTFVTEMIPQVSARLPGMIQQLLPALISAVSSLLGSLAAALPSLANTLVIAVKTIGTTLATSLSGDGLSRFMESGREIVSGIASGLASGIPEFLSQALPMIVSFTGSLRENIGKIVDMGLEIIVGLWKGIANSLPTLIANVPQIIINICGVINDNMPKILATGVQLIAILAQGIVKAVPALIANFPKICEAIIAVISAIQWMNLGSKIITGITNGVKNLASNLPNAMKSIINNVKTAFKNVDWNTVGRNIIQGVVNGVKAVGHLLKDAIIAIANSALDAVKSFFGIASPSKVMRDQVGKFLTLGMAEGITDYSDSAINAMTDASQAVSDAATFSMNSDVTASGTGVAGYGEVSGVTINVYGAEGQSSKDIAEKVADIINNNIYRQRAVFA